MRILEFEVLIVGAGPAGATAALNLAPFRKVALVAPSTAVFPRVGESVPAVVRRLLADMGLLEAFESEGHIPSWGNHSIWGTTTPIIRDSLRDPDGHGWHLDRVRLESWLRGVAQYRGAKLMSPAIVQSLERDGRHFVATVITPEKAQTISAEFLIDAGGRASPAARRLGARRRIDDHLVCRWICGRENMPDSSLLFNYVQAVEDGWWYTAPLPELRRIVAFHTDAGTPVAAAMRDRTTFLARAAATSELAAILVRCGFSPDLCGGIAPAHSSVLLPCASDNWLAAGDAALAFDPLSSQGILNALFTGLAGAESAHQTLSGELARPSEYTSTIADIYRLYRRQLRDWYRAETRWPVAPFWRRRHQMPI